MSSAVGVMTLFHYFTFETAVFHVKYYEQEVWLLFASFQSYHISPLKISQKEAWIGKWHIIQPHIMWQRPYRSFLSMHLLIKCVRQSAQSTFTVAWMLLCREYLHLIKIRAHQMVSSSLRQPLCGGEALTNVPFGAETRLHRNGILSRNKRLKLSDSSSSSAEQAWMQHSEATESHCGGVTLDQMTGVESSHAFTLHWGDTKQELSKLPCLTDSSPSSLPHLWLRWSIFLFHCLPPLYFSV